MSQSVLLMVIPPVAIFGRCMGRPPPLMLKRRGTPGYIAPELLLGGEVAVTEKADVYRWEKWDFSVPIVRC